MNKRSSIDQPLYNSVRSHILEKLKNGVWQPGAKIPTEPELAKLFSVSVGTVRKAVEDLVSEKVLIRRARIGTTVATHEQLAAQHSTQHGSPGPARVTGGGGHEHGQPH